jgi:hypothetical protein
MAGLSVMLGTGDAADRVSNFITGGWLGKKHKMARRGEGPAEIPYSLIGQLDCDFDFVNGDALPGGGDGTTESFPTRAPLSRPNAEFLCMAAKIAYEDHEARRGQGGPGRGGGTPVDGGVRRAGDRLPWAAPAVARQGGKQGARRGRAGGAGDRRGARRLQTHAAWLHRRQILLSPAATRAHACSLPFAPPPSSRPTLPDGASRDR